MAVSQPSYVVNHILSLIIFTGVMGLQPIVLVVFGVYGPSTFCPLSYHDVT